MRFADLVERRGVQAIHFVGVPFSLSLEVFLAVVKVLHGHYSERNSLSYDSPSPQVT